MMKVLRILHTVLVRTHLDYSIPMYRFVNPPCHTVNMTFGLGQPTTVPLHLETS